MINTKLCNQILENQDLYYRTYKKRVKKKNGYKIREIIAPLNSYKRLQKAINNELKDIFLISQISYAWREGINRKECLTPHLGNKYKGEADIKSFFPSISFDMVLDLFNQYFNKIDLGIPIEKIARLLTVPCGAGRSLPQGFVTSPLIANAIRFNMDNMIIDFCLKYNITVTNYGDNYLLSGSSLPYNFIKENIERIFGLYGFTLGKFWIAPIHKRQFALGLIFNKKITKDKDSVYDVIGLIKRGEDKRKVLGKINEIGNSENKKNYNYLIKLMKKVYEENS